MNDTEIELLCAAGLAREHASMVMALSTMAQSLAEIRRQSQQPPPEPPVEGSETP